MNNETLRAIHRFWFGGLAAPTTFPADKASIWFKRSAEIDRHIADTFGAYLPVAAKTEWDLTSLSREEQVGLVVLFDQFPRNLFRDSAEAFAFDGLARDIAGRLIAGGIERFHLIERNFLILPFEHSEAVADQDLSVYLMAALVQAAPEDQRDAYRGFLDFATKHRDLIRKFARFPHRNAVLGRASTPEEIAFLKTGRGF